jgi:hypothetical protein
MSGNTSATGGYLAPNSVNGSLDDKLFSEFLQPIVVGITGLAGATVRPRWQQNPPNLPDYNTNWCAVGTVRRNLPGFAAIQHTSAAGQTPGFDNSSRIVELDLLASFYGPDCEENADRLIMGFDISQNRETMLKAGYGFTGCEQPIITADLLNEQWTRRVDVGFSVRRGQTYTYPVLDLTGAVVTVTPDNSLPAEIITVA